MKIGEKIRQLRIKKQLTQEELANRIELTKGFISQVERDITSPSISTLVDILDCLGTNLRDFFNEAVDEKIVFKKDDIFVKEDKELKYRINWIIPNSQKNHMEPILLNLDVDGRTESDDPHDGEEFGYVLSGQIKVHLGGNVYKVKKGESFYFRPYSLHYIENAGKKPSTVLWVSSPPSF